MKYICIDLETTGLDPNTCQIIEFAAVIRDTNNTLKLEDSPSFHCYVKHDIYCGDPYALALNARILEQLGSKKPDAWVHDQHGLCKDFYDWCLENGYKSSSNSSRVHFVAAGKNFGNFDLQFLKKLDGWDKLFNVSSRILDPAMLWLKPKDDRVPGLKKCMERAGISGEVTHHALQDVYDTIKVLEIGMNRLWQNTYNEKT